MASTHYRKPPPAQRDAAAPSGNQPTHIAKMRRGDGDNATFERIGVAWQKDDGSIYVRLHGTQIVSEGFTLYANDGGAR